jgi:hypothetical protein
VSKEPDWSVVPRPVLRLIQACLEKDPKKRLRDIADGWRLLDETSTPSAASAAAATRRRMAVAAPWAFVAVALSALALLGWRHFGEPRPDVRRAQFELTPPDGMSFRDPFAVSPDGRRIAFAVAGANNVVRGLWVRSLESGEATLCRERDRASLGERRPLLVAGQSVSRIRDGAGRAEESGR